MWRGTFLCTLVLASACGDNTSGSVGFGDLVADPAVVTGCRGEPVAAGQTRAKVVECADEVPAGLLAAGRVGDIVIENAIVEVVIRASGEGFVFPGTGAGSIVDATRVGGIDGIKEIISLAELNSLHATEVVITEAGDDGPATVTVRGHVEPIPLLVAAVGNARAPVVLETQYILPPNSDSVQIRSRLLADEGEETTPQVGDLFFFGGRISAWLPGIGIAEEIANAEFVASTGEDVSFGVSYPADQSSVQFLSIESITGALGPSVATTDRGPTDPIDRFFIIGDGSVSSITDRAWQLREEPTGSISGTTAPGVEVVARDAADRPITMARADSNGDYTLNLPVGAYQLTAESLERGPGESESISVMAGGDIRADLTAGARGTLRLTVAEDGAGPIPARVVLRRDAERRIHFVGADGELTLGLPPGDWTLDVSRGVEYDAFTVTPLTIVTDNETAITATLDRVVDTDGWISLDTHLHSEMSLDSTIPLEQRLLAVAAEGVDVAVATDHDFVTNYQPVIDKLGLGDFINHRTGAETSSFAFGHFNGWPYQRAPERAAGGAVAWYGLPPGDVFAAMRAAGNDVLVQINHPRDGSSGFFNLIDFNRDLGMSTQNPADLGFPGADFNDFNFDAIEVGNTFDDEQFPEAFADYLALAAAGHPAAATGSSDSHGASRFAGNSRTYVFVGAGNDNPATADLDAVDAAIKARKVVVSQGAFVTAQLETPAGNPAELGTLVDLSGETDVVVRIKVQAPPWMQLRSVVVYHGRDIATTLLLDDTATAPVRFDGTITVPIGAGDDFIVVLTEPAGRGDPVLGQPDASFTNPLLYDADGDGSWK